MKILIVFRYTILNTCEQRWFDRIRGGSAPQNMARLPKDFLPQIFGSVREKSAENAVAPHYLAEPFSSALKPGSESEAFFCHIAWRQAHGSHTRAKKGKKATPRYVAGPFAPLCCVYSGFGGIPAILSGGNPPRYKTNHTIGRILFLLKDGYTLEAIQEDYPHINRRILSA